MVAPKLSISWGPKLPLGSQFWSVSDPQIVNNFAEHLAQIVDKFASSASPGHESSSYGTGFGASPSFDLLRRAADLFAVHPTIQD
jgi:hypothetical protein